MELTIREIDSSREDVDAALSAIRERLSPRGDIVSEAGRQLTIDVFGAPLAPQQVVEQICADVSNQGLPALLRYSSLLDRADLSADTLRVPEEEIDRAHAQADPAFLESIRRIRDNIVEFQTAILHRDVVIQRAGGGNLRQRYLPLRRVGVCVPGGAAAYPSTVLMTAVPARVAGVEEIVVVAPPTDFGAHNQDVLATCREVGVSEVYRVGGAQAVAALAYGVDGMPPVDKIVGPGNMFVALAKKHVYGAVDIDSIAGPSEVVVIADRTTDPAFAAADLLAQAEHAPGASVLVTWDAEVLQAIRHELAIQVAELSRSDLTLHSLQEYGALILVNDESEACRVTNLVGPEHLQIAIDDAKRLLPKLVDAGAIFLGNYSPVAVGDYAAGPSHVLPTGGTARWASGLTANDFQRSTSVIEFSRAALANVAPDVQALADKEGLTAHRHSVDIRLARGES